VDAPRVQELRAAREQALADLGELARTLDEERAEADKARRSHKVAKARADERVKALAVLQQPTPAQWDQLNRAIAREDDLEAELRAVETRVQDITESLRSQESRVQQLERALALAMAQARTLAWKQARSPKARATALIVFIGQLLLVRQGLWGGFVRNLYLGTRVVGALAWMLPKGKRARWKDESVSELEDLKLEGAPLLGDAIRIALRTPWLALVLWNGAWRRSPTARWLPRLKPVWIGLGTVVATFWAGAAGIGQHPTEWQTRKLVAASLLTGVVAMTGSFKGRRPRRRSRRRRKR
jgi:hypothetical protein